MTLALASPPVIPCSPFPEGYLCAIIQAISRAWSEICEDGLNDPSDEDATTTQLHAKLVDMLDEDEPKVPLFTCKHFETPSRDGKHCNADSSSIDQMPDLSFRISGELGIPHKHKAIFVECKVLDKSRDVNLYCKHGIRRFVDGKYAFRMPHAMMIAYVSDYSYSVLTSLDEYFTRNRSFCAKHCLPIETHQANFGPQLRNNIIVTIHPRSFNGAPGAIALNHLWLAVPKGCSSTLP